VHKPNLLFAIDVSGTPFTTTIIGCVSFNIKNSPQNITKFKKKFKKHKNKKGKDLDHGKLAEILQFLDKNKIRSNCIYLNSNDWKYILGSIPKNKAYRKEKVFGILYYLALKENSKPKYPYLVILPNDQ
jgi:hypothetical protein